MISSACIFNVIMYHGISDRAWNAIRSQILYNMPHCKNFPSKKTPFYSDLDSSFFHVYAFASLTQTALNTTLSNADDPSGREL